LEKVAPNTTFGKATFKKGNLWKRLRQITPLKRQPLKKATFGKGCGKYNVYR
jgi:hypothetical protein